MGGQSVVTFVGTLIIVAMCTSSCHAKPKAKSDLRLKVDELFALLDMKQVKHDRPYLGPDLWEEHAGVYPSEVRLNFVGPPEVAELRHLIQVFDNNMFATSWITICLLEAYIYGHAPKPTPRQLKLALEAIGTHHDKNRPYNNSVMAFWPQAYDANVSMWVSTPENLLYSFDAIVSMPWENIDKILEYFGWTDVEIFIQDIIKSKNGYLRSFHIPPDFDDTFVNLGLGALLTDLAQDVPEALALWRRQNSNLTSALDALKQYAYRPFSKDLNINTIDPRTYYFLRFFLEDAKSKGLDVALVPTWIQNIEEARMNYYREVCMPFQVNNIDVTVSANAVFGLTAGVLSGLLPLSVLDDPQLRQIYHNTTGMIIFMTEHALFGRRDLSLTYYPSEFEFYWFVARTYHRMETARLSGPLPPVMQDLYPALRTVLEGAMTINVIKQAKAEGTNMLFYDDFLGDADTDANNNTLTKAEDRLYTTTMAVNALLTTWTLFNATSFDVKWKPETPTVVKSTVDKCIRFLDKHILGVSYKPWNAFFSGSSKGITTWPYNYPGNRVELLNGTIIPVPNRAVKNMLMYGMQGSIPEREYQAQLKRKHFGQYTPTEFVTYNNPKTFFPFWSSSAYTYATTMLAFGRYDRMNQG